MWTEINLGAYIIFNTNVFYRTTSAFCVLQAVRSKMGSSELCIVIHICGASCYVARNVMSKFVRLHNYVAHVRAQYFV